MTIPSSDFEVGRALFKQGAGDHKCANVDQIRGWFDACLEEIILDLKPDILDEDLDPDGPDPNDIRFNDYGDRVR